MSVLERVDDLDEEPLHTGVMIALFPESPEKYALGSEPVDQMHVTLGFLGDADDLDRQDVATIASAVRAAANAADGPITTVVTGWRVLGDEDGGAIVLLLDGPGLVPAHDAVWSLLDVDEWPEQFVPWLPHMTLGYVDHEKDPEAVQQAAAGLVGATITFNQVGSAVRGEQNRIPLWADVSRETTQFANPYHDERGRFARKNEGRRVPTKGIDDLKIRGQGALSQALANATDPDVGLDVNDRGVEELAQILPTEWWSEGRRYEALWTHHAGGGEEVMFQTIITDQEGRPMGSAVRSFARDSVEGDVYAFHDRLRIDSDEQGQGIGTAFLKACEDAYVKAGITEIRLHANLDVGGYAWARAGFDWANPDEGVWALDGMISGFYEPTDPPEIRDELLAMQSSGQMPTPFELSRVGYSQRRIVDGRTTWWGKEMLMTMEWNAKKILVPEGEAIAASAGTSRSEFHLALGNLHFRYSAAHAIEAPAAPERKDGALWNLDFWSPPAIEDEFQAAAAELVAGYRWTLRTEFANPYHDERGRFARKGEGRRVPTRGVADDGFDDAALPDTTPDPNQLELPTIRRQAEVTRKRQRFAEQQEELSTLVARFTDPDNQDGYHLNPDVQAELDDWIQETFPSFIGSAEMHWDQGYTGHGRVEARATLFDENFQEVGRVTTQLREDAYSGRITGYHEYIGIHDHVQGQGIGSDVLSALDSTFYDLGVNEIRLDANIDVGGFAWARAGYDFQNPERDVPKMLARVNETAVSIKSANEIVAMERRINDGDYPTPYEISQIGVDNPHPDVHGDGVVMWDGKYGMLGSRWDAEKVLDPDLALGVEEDAVAASAGPAPGRHTRQARLARLARLHHDYSVRHATDAPPAPDRKDGGLWNLDFWSPPTIEAEFQTATANLFTTPSRSRGRLAEFANPYHDERGRFARKGEGRRVPTRGVADEGFDDAALPATTTGPLTILPDGTATISHDDANHGYGHPDFQGVQVKLGPPVDIGLPGQLRAYDIDGEHDGGGEGAYVYVSETGAATRVDVTGTGGWEVNNQPFKYNYIAQAIVASQAIDPTIRLQFGWDRGTDEHDLRNIQNAPATALVSYGWHDRIVIPQRKHMYDQTQWDYYRDEASPGHYMPAARKASHMEYVMAHEHGHVAHFGLAHRDGIMDMGSTNSPEWRKRYLDPVGAVVKREVKRRGSPLLAAAHLGISFYGMQNPQEAVAESYAQYVVDPANLGDGPRRVLELAGLVEP